MAKFSRQFSLVLLILSLIFLISTKVSSVKSDTVKPAAAVVRENVVVKEKDVVLAFVGDIMLDRGVKYSVYKNFGVDYSQLFANVKEKLLAYDLLFGNLEGPVSDKGMDEGGIYSFRMEPQSLSALKVAGFDVVSVANNHIFNWGQAAFTDTLERLTASGIKYAGGGFDGPGAYSGAQINVSGVKITVLGFSEFNAGGVESSSTYPGIAVISDKNIINSVKKARLDSDIVIASFHFGEEYQKLPNVYQERYAKLAVDSGADLIIGHHPHVVETLEKYRDSYIIYSLGNFIFDQYFSPDTMSGGLLEVKVNTRTKKIENVALKKVSLNKWFQLDSILP